MQKNAQVAEAFARNCTAGRPQLSGKTDSESTVSRFSRCVGMNTGRLRIRMHRYRLLAAAA
jgi:hypothetical protein